MLPPNAYELLLGALERDRLGLRHRQRPPAHALAAPRSRGSCAKAFARTQLKTHVTRFRPLLADRTAWNKLFRRSFWDEHGFRFPEGVRPRGHPRDAARALQGRDRSTSSPTRSTSTGSARAATLSITQRRLEPKRAARPPAAVEHVDALPRRARAARAQRWYHASVVADDLRYYLNVLDRADDDYRASSWTRVNAFLDGVDASASTSRCRRSSG